MAPTFKHSSSLVDVWHIPDDERSFSPHVEKSSPSLPTAVDSASVDLEITYPEGGLDAWLVVLGACCGLTASLSIYNTAGVFEVVISKMILPEESSSTLGWIFSTYAFVKWICGVQIGPTFDAKGPRALMIAGTICTLIGIFSLNVYTGKISSYDTRASLILVTIC